MKYHQETDFEIESPVSISKIKRLEIEILRTFVQFCEVHHLKYFLAGGTLIGAVRHQGFVPWDDDMDVSMPRPDFERFRELTSDGKLGRYEIRSTIHTPEIHARPFDRIVDPRYMTEVKADQMYIPPWIDVHALDGLPSDFKENKKHWDTARFYKWWSLRARKPLCQEKSWFKRIVKWVCFAPIRWIGPVYFADKLTEYGKKYDFYKSKYVAAYVAGYGRKEQMPGYYFTDGEEKMWFEGILCSVPPHYDLVLSHMYGDYMKLPQEKHRVFHMLNAWKVKNRAGGT